MWCSFDQCCHESEEGHRDAIPNTLDCPSSLRVDFEEQLFNLLDECTSELRHRNMSQLLEIRKFIKNQGKADKLSSEKIDKRRNGK